LSPLGTRSRRNFIRKLISCTAPTRKANPRQVRIRIKVISDLHIDPSKSSTHFSVVLVSCEQ
jgi:hypothetical protein